MISPIGNSHIYFDEGNVRSFLGVPVGDPEVPQMSSLS